MNETHDTALMAWNEKTIGDLTGGSLLSVEDTEKLKKCNAAITHSFHRVQMYRTRTEMEISVLSDIRFPTPDAKYWQTVREMNVFVEQLIELGFTYREKILDLEELEIPLPEAATRFEKERRNIAIQRKRFEIQCIQRDAHHRIREIEEWRQIQEKLIPQLIGGTDEVDNHQLISYTVWFLRQYKTVTEGGAKMAPDELQNLMGHVYTSMRVIRERDAMETLMKAIGGDVALVKFLRKQQVI